VLDEVIGAGDPEQLYVEMMRRSAKRVDGSGLGLGRVCAESGMSLSYRVDDETVYLHATTRVARALARNHGSGP
jgi:hypothetical protein